MSVKRPTSFGTEPRRALEPANNRQQLEESVVVTTDEAMKPPRGKLPERSTRDKAKSRSRSGYRSQLKPHDPTSTTFVRRLPPSPTLLLDSSSELYFKANEEQREIKRASQSKVDSGFTYKIEMDEDGTPKLKRSGTRARRVKTITDEENAGFRTIVDYGNRTSSPAVEYETYRSRYSICDEVTSPSRNRGWVEHTAKRLSYGSTQSTVLAIRDYGYRESSAPDTYRRSNSCCEQASRLNSYSRNRRRTLSSEAAARATSNDSTHSNDSGVVGYGNTHDIESEFPHPRHQNCDSACPREGTNDRCSNRKRTFSSEGAIKRGNGCNHYVGLGNACIVDYSTHSTYGGHQVNSREDWENLRSTSAQNLHREQILAARSRSESESSRERTKSARFPASNSHPKNDSSDSHHPLPNRQRSRFQTLALVATEIPRSPVHPNYPALDQSGTAMTMNRQDY